MAEDESRATYFYIRCINLEADRDMEASVLASEKNEQVSLCL